MKATLPKSAQKQQMFRMDPELAVALREGHKEVVLGSAPFGVDDPNETNESNELALVDDVEQMQFVSPHHFPTIDRHMKDRYHKS